jgi:hypothetical protein
MASGSCEASADCQAQASAQANASIECTPPSIALSYSFAADVDAEAQADFIANLGELKVRGGAILQGFTKYELLIKGKTDASGKVIVKSPVAELTASVQGLVDGAADIAADVPVFRLTCAIDAFGEAAAALGSVASKGHGQPGSSSQVRRRLHGRLQELIRKAPDRRQRSRRAPHGARRSRFVLTPTRKSTGLVERETDSTLAGHVCGARKSGISVPIFVVPRRPGLTNRRSKPTSPSPCRSIYPLAKSLPMTPFRS